MRARLSQQETEARVRTDAILEQLVNACRQVGRSSFILVQSFLRSPAKLSQFFLLRFSHCISA